MTRHTTGDGGDFEQRLRDGLADAARLADSSQGPEAIAHRARRRDRAATGGIAASLIAVTAVTLAVLTDRPGDVLLDAPTPNPTATAPTVTDGETASALLAPPPDPLATPAGAPDGRLVAAVDGRLVLTDLDGHLVQEVGWQPSTQDPIAEVVTDGETVVTWQPPCTLEAGSLVHGTTISLGSHDACDGPAAIDPETGAVLWLTGSSGLAAGDELTLAYFHQTATSAAGGGISQPGLFQPDDRVVGIDHRRGSTRLLVRRTGAHWVEVMALPLTLTDEGHWQLQPGGAEEGFRPAFVHLDGYKPLDVAGDWVLDALWTFPDGDRGPGTIEEVRIRPAGGAVPSSTSGGEPVDPETVWFDATGDVHIWDHGDQDEPRWSVFTVLDGRTTVWDGRTSGGVTAAAILPGSVVSPGSAGLPGPATPAETEPPSRPAPSTPPSPAPVDEDWAAVWCDDVAMVGVATTVDDGEPIALCADGRTPPLVGGGFGWTHPSIGAGAFALAAAAVGASPPAITVVGQEPVNIEGATPALSLAGRIAWTTRSLDATTIHVAERRADIGDALGEGYELPGELVVTHLSWARDSRFLFVTTRTDTGEIGAWVVDTAVPHGADDLAVPDPRVQPIEASDGQVILAVAGEIDTSGAGVLLTVDQDGAVRISGLLVAEGSTPLPAPRIMALSVLDGEVADALRADDATPQVTAVGVGRPDDDGAWASGSTIAWLVGDGQRVWHVPAGQSPTLYLDGVAAIAVDPSAG